MQEFLKNAEILYDKALYKECYKIVRKAKKIALDHEEFYFSLELINICFKALYVLGICNTFLHILKVSDQL